MHGFIEDQGAGCGCGRGREHRVGVVEWIATQGDLQRLQDIRRRHPAQTASQAGV